jgi:hypothetical protein
MQRIKVYSTSYTYGVQYQGTIMHNGAPKYEDPIFMRLKLPLIKMQS